jgi:hypothetical protein
MSANNNQVIKYIKMGTKEKLGPKNFWVLQWDNVAI